MQRKKQRFTFANFMYVLALEQNIIVRFRKVQIVHKNVFAEKLCIG